MASNLKKIKVSRSFKKLNNPELITFALGTVFTDDPKATTPNYNDAAVHGAAGDLQDAGALRQINPSPKNTKAETVCRNILIDMLDANADYLAPVVNKVAKDAADVAAGEEVVTRIGFQVAGKGGGKRNIGFIDSGPGWAHAHENKSRKGTEGHVWNVGITDAKDTPPKESVNLYSLEADYIFNDIESGSVLAYCHGSVVPVNQKATPSGLAPSGSILSKSATIIPMSKTKHPVISFKGKTNVIFGEWRYIVIP